MRQTLPLLPLLCLAGCLTAKEPDAPAPPPAGMAGLAVTRSNVFNMLTSPAKLAVNGAEIRTLAVTDDYSGPVAPGQVVLTVSSLSGGRYSYRFKADAGKTYHFIVAPRENITADGLAAGPGQAIETSGPFGIASMN
jgi:hypothetical protein